MRKVASRSLMPGARSAATASSTAKEARCAALKRSSCAALKPRCWTIIRGSLRRAYFFLFLSAFGLRTSLFDFFWPLAIVPLLQRADRARSLTAESALRHKSVRRTGRRRAPPRRGVLLFLPPVGGG